MNKFYRIIISITEALFFIILCVLFSLADFGRDEPINWIIIWSVLATLVLIFILDCIITAVNGKMIYITKRKEAGFQATRYCYISLIASISISVIFWMAKVIPAISLNEKGIFSFLILLVVITTTMTCIFFFMIIMFLINNKIVLMNENFEKEKDNVNKNNLQKL